MISRLIPAAALALATVPANADSASARLLEPAGPWQVDFAPDRCRMGRTLGSGEDASIFFIEQWLPGPDATWRLAGAPFGEFNPRTAVRYRFADGDGGDFRFLAARFGELGPAIGGTSPLVAAPSRVAGALSLIDAAQAQSIDRLTVSQGSDTVTAHFGPVAEPLKVFNECVRQMVEGWGLDLAEQARISAPATASAADLAALRERLVRDYAEDARGSGGEAEFRLLAIVEADGRISRCSLNGAPLSSEAVTRHGPCQAFAEIVRPAPAKVAGGTPVRSYLGTRVAYPIDK